MRVKRRSGVRGRVGDATRAGRSDPAGEPVARLQNGRHTSSRVTESSSVWVSASWTVGSNGSPAVAVLLEPELGDCRLERLGHGLEATD